MRWCTNHVQSLDVWSGPDELGMDVTLGFGAASRHIAKSLSTRGCMAVRSIETAPWQCLLQKMARRLHRKIEGQEITGLCFKPHTRCEAFASGSILKDGTACFPAAMSFRLYVSVARAVHIVASFRDA